MAHSAEANFRKHQGSLLRVARVASNKTQSAVGELLNLSQDAISKMEVGAQPVDTFRLNQFAVLYQKPVSFFFMGSIPSKSTKS